MENIYTNNSVTLCSRNVCVNAKGKNAQIITAGVFVFLILLGVSMFYRVN